MSDKNSPPRIFGILLTLLGVALLVGGIQLISLGDTYYFSTVGILIAVSGIFIASGKLVGAYVYAVTTIIVVVWSIYEVGFTLNILIPRILLPVILCAYIFSSRLKSRLK